MFAAEQDAGASREAMAGMLRGNNEAVKFHEHALCGALHPEVWVVDDRAFWRAEDLKTHEQLKTNESKDFETAKAQVFNSSPGQFLNETLQDGGGRVIRWQLRLQF